MNNIDKLSDLAHQADEGIQYMLDRPKLADKIEFYNKLQQLHTAVKKFINTLNVDVLDNQLQFYRQNNIAKREGEDAYGTSIWNFQVEVRGNASFLEDILNGIEKLWLEEKNK